MAAFTDLSAFVNRATGGNSGTPEDIWFYKDARVGAAAAPATIAGRMHSLWLYEGQPSAGATPGAVAIPDNTTTGGLRQTDPGGGREKWMSFAAQSPLVAGTLILYDRLLHIGGLSGTTATAQTVGGTLTRNTGGIGNFIIAEIYTQVGTTATTVTATYTNQAGTGSRTTVATTFGGTGFREQTRAIYLPLQSSDYGVQAVADVDLGASTLTAGNWGVTVCRPLAMINGPIIGAGGTISALVNGKGPIKIDTDACLGLLWMANGTTAPQIFGNLFTCEA